MKRATKPCNLKCSFAAERVMWCCAFYHPRSNLSCNKSGCSRLCDFIGESREWLYFFKQNFGYMLCVLLPQGNRFCSKWRNHRVRRGVTPSLPIRSQYSRTLQQPNLLQDRFERDCRGKTRTISFRVVLRQFFETSCTFLMPSVLPLVSGMQSRDGSI